VACVDWGHGDRDWDVAVFAGSDIEELQDYFREVTVVARIRDPWRVPEEQDVPVFVVRGPYVPIATAWPRFEGRN